MFEPENRKAEMEKKFVCDIVYTAVGLLVVLLSAAVFWEPEANRLLFPVIFFLCFGCALSRGFESLKKERRKGKGKTAGFLLLALALVLLTLAAASAASIFWR